MNKPASYQSRVLILTLVMVFGISGCATGPDKHPDDPLEPLNRSVYQFNDVVDRSIVKPLARGYNAVAPAPVNLGVTNFFNNLDDVRSALNNLLQFKIRRAFSTVGRVVVNSTVGVLGLIDVASNLDLPRYQEDFGQTLGVWGMGSGPFIVVPFLGPSSGRDGAGLVVDWFTHPIRLVDNDGLRWGLRGLDLVDTRADLLNASRVLDQAALDPYAFVRDAYLQRREDQVYDGNPPLDSE